jgi:hypothetical protein
VTIVGQVLFKITDLLLKFENFIFEKLRERRVDLTSHEENFSFSFRSTYSDKIMAVVTAGLSLVNTEALDDRF